MDEPLRPEGPGEAQSTDAAGGEPASRPSVRSDGRNIPDADLYAPRPIARPFNAELDLSEFDERGRPGPVWTARAAGLSRSNLIVLSRRMSYVRRIIVAAVHLIDDEPVPLAGRVHSCEYNGDGQYRLDLDLLPLEEIPGAVAWVRTRGTKRAG